MKIYIGVTSIFAVVYIAFIFYCEDLFWVLDVHNMIERWIYIFISVLVTLIVFFAGEFINKKDKE